MSSSHPGTPGSADGGPADHPPPSAGPRVTSDDVRDLGRLRRSTTDRKVAGVAGGIARHLDIDPVVVRIAFVVLVFFGGGGLLLYAGCWLFVPEDRTHQAVINVDGRSRTAILVIAAVLAGLATVGDSLGGFGFPWPLAIAAVGVAIYLAVKQRRPAAPAADGDAADGAPPPAAGGAAYARYRPPPPLPDPRRRGPVWFWFTLGLAAVGAGVVLSLQLAGLAVPLAAYPAVVVAACGTMLLVGAFYGRAGGLIPLGLLAAVTTLVLSAATPIPDQMFSVGQTRVSPAQLSDLDESYAVGMGEIKIDLTGTDLTEAEDQSLDLDVGMGHIQVLVPPDGLTVDVDADIGLGEIKVFDNKYSDRADDRFGEDGPVLTITADGRIGQIEIVNPEDLP